MWIQTYLQTNTHPLVGTPTKNETCKYTDTYSKPKHDTHTMHGFLHVRVNKKCLIPHKLPMRGPALVGVPFALAALEWPCTCWSALPWLHWSAVHLLECLLHLRGHALVEVHRISICCTCWSALSFAALVGVHFALAALVGEPFALAAHWLESLLH